MQILEIPLNFPPPLPFTVELGWERAVVFDIGMGKKGVEGYLFLKVKQTLSYLQTKLHDPIPSSGTICFCQR